MNSYARDVSVADYSKLDKGIGDDDLRVVVMFSLLLQLALCTNEHFLAY